MFYDSSRIAIWDDFTAEQSDLFWVDTIPDLGSAVVNDAFGGIMTLSPSDETIADNDEVYLAWPNEIFMFKSGKTAYARCRLQFLEANADDANVIFGFMSGVGANTLLDNGGGPATGGQHCLIYKMDGEQVWHCQTRDFFGYSDTHTTLRASVIQDQDDIGGELVTVTPYRVLEIFLTPDIREPKQLLATFAVDGLPLITGNGDPIKQIAHTVRATEMTVVVGIKNGGVGAESLLVDYVGAEQAR